MATREELERPMAEWLADPCYDLEDADGFEEHRDELRRYREETTAAFKRKREEILRERAAELGCTVALCEELERMQRAIEGLQDRVRELENG